MAVSVAAVAAKAAAAAVSSKQGRTAVATVVTAVLLPFMLAVVVVLSLLDGTTNHNVAAVKQAFFGGTLTGQIPQEYREYMEDIQKSFVSIDQLISEIENLEDGAVDDYRIKSLFYALYFGDEQPTIRAQRRFVDCFIQYEERIRQVENEDGTITEEPYLAAVYITDLEQIYHNLELFLGKALTYEQKYNALRIYQIVTSTAGETFPNDSEGNGNQSAGESMGDGSFRALLAEAKKYIGMPYVWGGSNPSEGFDCSGYVCWVYSHAGVYPLSRTSAQGIYNQCVVVSREEMRPGDLVFFSGTYATTNTVSHVGIYVGGNQMLHCGDPIGYANINSSYWMQHFYAVGRLNTQ